jgi:hypothetical protein
MKNCGDRVSAGPNTSCPFAKHVCDESSWYARCLAVGGSGCLCY